MQRSIFSRGVRKGLEKLLVAELQEKDDTGLLGRGFRILGEEPQIFAMEKP